ncbi:hypothetical protein C0993_008858 [Termitomyces sp. T159_Od127]|nr:hypothetical protein C0993_008858 [Termitomyces sp. T159_Od127]
MSLLTPPSTKHRRTKDKENARDADLNPRVAWAENDSIHVLQLAGPAAASFKVSTAASASKRLPAKSILKKCAQLAPWPEEKQREVTPEPSDPLVDFKYLVYPVKTIVDATDATELRVLIEAYSILTARLRAAITGEMDDASWPLFQPLRKHREAFVEAVVRDLGKALVDPAAGEKEKEPVRVLLPSPSNTPVKKKKRDGMSAEQVKYARDLCTTSHAVIRLLSLIFTLPAMMSLFTDIQLRSMFTAVLAIPLAEDLPTPNARKTWALAIWLIQTQRLSAAVLTPAADRIAFALCRGIDGELGKEGKKGSASDGLKAIHDLSVHLPEVFIPAFTESLLPSVLASLLAPTVALRTYAAHALGGIVIGATSIPNSSIHAQISDHVLKYITTLPPPRATPSPTKRASPTKPSLSSMPQTPTKPQEPSIVRTLRTTLQATEPAHVAHGPIWAICVLSALIVLLGPAAMRIPHLRVLVQLGMRHKNRNVRALTTVMWRCIIWVYVRPRLITADEEGEEDMDEREMERDVKLRDEWWKVVASVVEMETGVCAIAATIGSGNIGVPVYDSSQWVDTRLSAEEREEQPLKRALEVLCVMAGKDAPTRESAVDTMRAMMGMPPSMRNVKAREYEKEERTLVPRGLFSAMPGLLTTEYGALKEAVKALFDETPKAEDVRVLSKAEMRKVWVWEGVVKAWRAAVGAGKGEDGERERKGLLHVWEGMVSLGLGAALDPEDEDPDRDIDATPPPHDEELAADFIERATNVIIIHVLEDADLDLQPSSSLSTCGLARTGSRGLDIPGFSSSPKSSIAKIGLARGMWNVISRLAPHTCIGSGAERLSRCLMKNVEEYTTFGNPGSTASRSVVEEEVEDEKEMNEAWAELCVDVLAACGHEVVRAFWHEEGGNGVAGWRASERALVWRVFARGWVLQNSDAGWEGAVCTLAVPFSERESWTLTSEDADAWQKLLDFAIAASLDHGHDSNTVLGVVARLVDDRAAGYMPVHIRLVEFVLNHLVGVAAKGDLRELPEVVLDFVAMTMNAAYPPPQDQTTYTWAVRAVTSLIDQCPGELLGVLGETMSGALAAWLADAEDKWDKGVVEYDIVPLYETLLVTIQGRASVSLLSCFGPALCAPLVHETRAEIRGPAVDAFRDFWDTTYADAEVPEGGWTSDIAACLSSVYGAPEEERVAVIAELEAAFIPRPTTPTPSMPRMILSTHPTPRSPSASHYNHITPKTLSTPPRPPRSFTRLVIQSPESPMRNSRLAALSRPPTPGTSRSPTKRRKLAKGNKENFSPAKDVTFTPVIDRILASSPLVTKVKLGKRRFEEDSSEDEKNVAKSLIPPEDDVFFVTHTPKPTPNVDHRILAKTTTKKRKRMVMDAVEMPPLSKIYGRTLRPSASFELPRTPTMVKRSISRSRSESKVSALSSEMTRSSKRRKGAETAEEGEEVSNIGMIDLRALIPSENRVSFYPYSLVRQRNKRLVPSSELSSDDDPHLGQVTPHHLISPDLKRVKVADLTDPPSDDSVIASSPSRDLVKRRLQRAGSRSSIEVTPFFV